MKADALSPRKMHSHRNVTDNFTEVIQPSSLTLAREKTCSVYHLVNFLFVWLHPPQKNEKINVHLESSGRKEPGDSFFVDAERASSLSHQLSQARNAGFPGLPLSS